MPNGRPYSKRHPFERFKRWLKLLYYRILRIDDPPERIARGAAIGVLMGVLPTFGVGGFLSIGIAFLLKANKAAAVLGSFIVNPITSPFFWTLSAVIGSFIMREDSSTILSRIKQDGILASAGWVWFVYMVGNVIISAVCTAFSYYMVKAAIIRHRKKKEEKRLKRQSGGG